MAQPSPTAIKLSRKQPQISRAFQALKIHSHADRECPGAGDGIRLLKRSVWIRSSQAAEVRRVDIRYRIQPSRRIQHIDRIDTHLEFFRLLNSYALDEIRVESDMRRPLDPSLA